MTWCKHNFKLVNSWHQNLANGYFPRLKEAGNLKEYNERRIGSFFVSLPSVGLRFQPRSRRFV